MIRYIFHQVIFLILKKCCYRCSNEFLKSQYFNTGNVINFNKILNRILFVFIELIISDRVSIGKVTYL